MSSGIELRCYFKLLESPFAIGFDESVKIPDYTFTYNAANYEVRNLYVFVRPLIVVEDIGHLLADADVDLAAGAVLDLNTSTQAIHTVTGQGTIANGTLATSAVLSPAGDGVVGTLALSNVGFAAGTRYTADLGDLLLVNGSLNLSGLIISINNPEALVRSQIYTLIHTTGGITGSATLETQLPTGWRVQRDGNNMILAVMRGTVLHLR